MEIGEVRVAEDADFNKLKQLCDCNDGWKQEYHKNNTTVWTKANDVSDFKMIKVHSVYNDVSAAAVYDVLHDPIFRKVWDSNMYEGYEIAYLNPNNDIGYYALKTPSPLKNRDFVIQRSWLDTGKEYLIINHSINHKDYGPRKGFVRGISYLTGYWIQPKEGKSTESAGCKLTYVTQADPKGKLPVWVVNKATQYVAPKVMKKIHRACREYPSWKSKNNPACKPWLFPEQITLPRLVKETQIAPMQQYPSSDSIDESGVREEDMDDDYKDDENL